MLRLLCLCCLAFPASALTLSIDLGETNRADGLSVPSEGDGVNAPAVRGGRACRVVSGERSHYLYVQIDDAQLHHTDATLYLTCDLWDDGPQLIGVQYDRVAQTPSIATCYTEAPSLVALGSGKWVRRTSVLEHARCGNGQNSGADLRLSGQAAVARLEISDQPPAGYDPEQPIRPLNWRARPSGSARGWNSASATTPTPTRRCCTRPTVSHVGRELCHLADGRGGRSRTMGLVAVGQAGRDAAEVRAEVGAVPDRRAGLRHPPAGSGTGRITIPMSASTTASRRRSNRSGIRRCGPRSSASWRPSPRATATPG